MADLEIFFGNEEKNKERKEYFLSILKGIDYSGSIKVVYYRYQGISPISKILRSGLEIAWEFSNLTEPPCVIFLSPKSRISFKGDQGVFLEELIKKSNALCFFGLDFCTQLERVINDNAQVVKSFDTLLRNLKLVN